MQPQEIAQKLDIRDLKEQPNLDRLITSSNSFVRDSDGKVIALNVSGNKLTDEKISFLWELTQLQALNLSENQLTAISVPAGMKALRYLNVSENSSLVKFTFEKGLSALEKLDLSNSGLREVVFPAGFKTLHTVDLQKNQLTRVIFEGSCPALKLLDLNGNQLKELNVSGDLPLLELLYLQGGNKVRDISFLSGSPLLQTLNLSKNAVADLSPVRHLLDKGIPFSWKSAGAGVLVADCPLTTPSPEIVKEGNDAIARYFEELKKGTAFLYEAKVLLVGESEVGKTSLLRKLQDENNDLPKPKERTRGIDIVRLPFTSREGQQIFMNVWDFGGQEIYHATHRFFLTHRSLYVLLTDTSRQEDNFDYWIPNIQLFGGDSPILAVKNKKYDFDREITVGRFVEKFNIQSPVLPVNLFTNEGLPQLRDNIFFKVEQLPVIGSELPASWVQVREELEKMSREIHYMEYYRFKQLCRSKGIEEDIKIEDLGKYLHDLGIILWYHDLGALKSKVILAPQWATNAVYRIIDDTRIQKQKGHFYEEDIQRLWNEKQYQEMHQELLALMEAFKLCYKKKNGQGYIIPSMLPADGPDLPWDQSDNLRLEYEYTFMPKGIVNQLTAQLSELIPQDEWVWGRGVYLKDQLSKAKVEEDLVNRTIFVNTRGFDARSLMRIISRELENIHKTYPGIQFTKKVPCPCETCMTNQTPNFFYYNKLIERLQSGKKQIYCNDGDTFVDIENILLKVGIQMPVGHGKDSLRLPQDVPDPERPTQPLKVFFSYSKHDRESLEELKRHLSVLRRNGKLQTWDDHHILPGEDWDEEVKNELAAADIILLLVSANSLATDYIWGVEITGAMERHEKKEVWVIPIILSPCKWNDTPFWKLNSLPSKAKPVSSYPDRDQAWLEVVEGIERVIDKRR